MQKKCQNCKKDFIIESDDQAFYEKMNVPTPTFCSLCRAQRRFAFRNERVLYKTTSKLSGKNIFTAYDPASGVESYDIDEWHSDGWDPLTYGEDVDFSRPFFEQFRDFMRKVPLKSRNVVMGSNSPYCNNATDPKNCYLVFNSSFVEDCMYSGGLYNSQNCLDCSHSHKCEECYQGFWNTACTKCFYCSYCQDSFDMWFSKNCAGCNNCFGCFGLRKKSYCMWNEQLTKEEYEERLTEMQLGSRKNIELFQKKAHEFWLKFPNKFMTGIHNTNVSGSYINNSKNVQDSFLVRACENLKYCQYLEEESGTKDSYDFSIWGDNCEQVYETHASGSGIQNVKFCTFTQEQSHDIEYSMVCSGSSNLFGCISLRNKSYCIFNKQYTKEEYEELVPKIKKHMNNMPYVDKVGRGYKYGEFFPIEISPFAYNETLAQEYFPLTKEQALEYGYRWYDAGERDYKPTQDESTLPDNIDEIEDTITDEIIQCGNTGNTKQLCTTAFRVVADEVSFYKKHKLPLPTQCSNCRTFNRLQQRQQLQNQERQCMCNGATDKTNTYNNKSVHEHHKGEVCSNTFTTAYGSSGKEIVYCEKCYQGEMM